MAQMRIFEAAIFSVLVVLCLLLAAVKAQDEIYSPEVLVPAPAPVVGAGFSMSSSIDFTCFSVLLAIGFLLH
ncbi:hypothetical protein CASFOL_008563 [Castilleja foliolosa]|uniref:Transmembrane protein n=1 Tax=Castilleja foliolosa TaxID=1961234 RepID=A0ABD3DZB8_9LAMI